jgi:hypothetical protein
MTTLGVQEFKELQEFRMTQVQQLGMKQYSYSATLALLARFDWLSSTRANSNSELPTSLTDRTLGRQLQKLRRASLQLLNSLSYHVDR